MKKLLILIIAALLFTSCGTQTKSNSKNKANNKAAEQSEITLDEVYNWLGGDIWNKGFCDIYHYVEDGKGATGNDIDIEFTVDELKVSMEKKDKYEQFILSLDESVPENAQIIKAWKKLSEQMDILYNKVISETPRPKDPDYEFNTDLFSQYLNSFEAAYRDIKWPDAK